MQPEKHRLPHLFAAAAAADSDAFRSVHKKNGKPSYEYFVVLCSEQNAHRSQPKSERIGTEALIESGSEMERNR